MGGRTGQILYSAFKTNLKIWTGHQLAKTLLFFVFVYPYDCCRCENQFGSRLIQEELLVLSMPIHFCVSAFKRDLKIWVTVFVSRVFLVFVSII